MIMPQLIITTYVSLTYELKKNWKDSYEKICWDWALVL
jgi:hypothetical protein